MYLGFAWFNLVFVMITIYMIIGWAIAAMLCICHYSKRDIQMYFRKHKKYILNNEEKNYGTLLLIKHKAVIRSGMQKKINMII